jgi:hypothetical protein
LIGTDRNLCREDLIETIDLVTSKQLCTRWLEPPTKRRYRERLEFLRDNVQEGLGIKKIKEKRDNFEEMLLRAIPKIRAVSRSEKVGEEGEEEEGEEEEEEEEDEEGEGEEREG